MTCGAIPVQKKLGNPDYWLWSLLLLSFVAVFSKTTGEDRIAANLSLTYDNDDEDNVIDLSQFGTEIYGKPDSDTTGLLVAEYSHSMMTLLNPEELGSYLEGDILVPTTIAIDKNGLKASAKRWRGAVVPYLIRGNFKSNQLASIHKGFMDLQAKTCIKFRERTNENDYIVIENGPSGCWSSVGRIGGRQIVNLQTPACLRQHGTIIHELMHSIGFLHEQNRHNRDEFVRVLQQNVRSGMLGNFKKSSSEQSYGFGVRYDYGSVMHYSPNSFSKNGKPTLVALKNDKDSKSMGQRKGLSKSDVKKINEMYKCH